MIFGGTGILQTGKLRGQLQRRIARHLAHKAKVLGMDVLYTDIVNGGDIDGFKYTDMDTILKEADYITLHTPLTEDTKGMFDRHCFKKMKNTAYLINCARGGIVVESDLLDALDKNIIAGASLDCFVNEPQPMEELLKHPLVSVTPHIGAATKEAQERIGDEIVNIFLDHYKLEKNIIL